MARFELKITIFYDFRLKLILVLQRGHARETAEVF